MNLNPTGKLLADLQTYARSLHQAIDIQGLKPSGDDSLDILLKDLRESAVRLDKKATSPVKLGIVGAFSSGKSLLIGSLLGWAPTLPIKEVPTTGNVTSLHLKSNPNVSQTRIASCTLDFLTTQEIQDCARHLLGELGHQVDTTLSGDWLTRFEALIQSQSIPWEEGLQWCEEAWRVTNQPNLRNHIKEIAWFFRAYLATSPWLPGKSFQVDYPTATAALILPRPPGELQTTSFAQAVPSFNAPHFQTPQSTLTPSLVQGIFPLIRKVHLHVEIPSKVWDLHAEGHTNEWVLLDFPGLGASDSGVRDAFLCTRELSEVQTIIILLNARSCGDGQGRRLYEMLQNSRPKENLKDYVLVGVGRFDQIPVNTRELSPLLDSPTSASPNPEDEEDLDPLTGRPSRTSGNARSQATSAGVPLTQNLLLDRIEVLDRIKKDAEALASNPDRIVFLSPVLGLSAMRNQPDLNSLPLWDDSTGAMVSEATRKWNDTAPLWHQVTRNLQANDPQAPLGQWLQQFLSGGGLPALRSLIKRHLSDHGMKLLYKHCYQLAEPIRRNQLALREYLRPRLDKATDSESESAGSTQSQTLKTLLNDAASVYRKAETQFRESPPELYHYRGKSRQWIFQTLEQRLVQEFFTWPEWNHLLSRVQGERIQPLAPARSSKGGILGDWDTEEDQPEIPVDTEGFREVFTRTMKSLETFATQCVQEAINLWLDDLTEKLAPIRAELLPLLLEPTFEAHLRQSFVDSQKGQKLLDTLKRTLQPNLAASAIVEACFHSEHFPPTPSTANLFPLPTNPSRRFGWDPALAGQLRSLNLDPPPYSQHQIQIQRLRNELISSAQHHLTQWMGQVGQHALNFLIDSIGNTSDFLEKRSRDSAFLSCAKSQTSHPSESTDPGSSPWHQIALKVDQIPWPFDS